MEKYGVKLTIGVIVIGFYSFLINSSIANGGNDVISSWLPIFLHIIYFVPSVFIVMGIIGLFDPLVRNKILTSTLRYGIEEFTQSKYPITSFILSLILCYFLSAAGWEETLGAVIYFMVVSLAWNTSVRVFMRG